MCKMHPDDRLALTSMCQILLEHLQDCEVPGSPYLLPSDRLKASLDLFTAGADRDR